MRRLVSVLALAGLACCGGGGGGGDGDSDAYTEPVLVSQTLRFQDLQASGDHTCGVATDGALYCWGVNTNFALGTQAALDECDFGWLGLFDCTHEPHRVGGAPVLTRLVLSGSLTYPLSCGLTAGGSAYCWGSGQGGQLGNGSRGDSSISSTPVPVAGGLTFATLRSSLYGHSSCGVTSNGETWCWGGGGELLGMGPTAAGISAVPQRIDWGRRFVSYDMGERHACGVAEDGQAYCWGNNWYGTLGIGSAGGSGGTASTNRPQPVVGGLRFKAIATASDHTCALTETGNVYCWGASSAVYSEGGSYIGTPQPLPGDHVFVALRAGRLHSCGLKTDGTVWCWGQNYVGELGNGTTTPSTTPVQLRTSARFSQLSHRPTCALTADGQGWCWGDNGFGQLGRRSSRAR